MDVWRLTVAVLRRWYILIPLLALTGVAALQAGAGVSPQYDVTATAMISAGRAPSEVPNPYGGREDASQILAIVLNSNETRDQIAALGHNPEYTVDAASRSTIVRFSVQSLTPEAGIATLEAVLAAAVSELETRQGGAGVISGAQYTIDTLQAPSVSAVVDDGKTRVMAVVGVLGAALSFLVAVLFDDLVGLIKRWRRKRHDKRAQGKAGTDASASAETTGDAGDEPSDTAEAETARTPMSDDDDGDGSLVTGRSSRVGRDVEVDSDRDRDQTKSSRLATASRDD